MIDIEIVRFFYNIDLKIFDFLFKFFTLFGEAFVIVLFVAIIYLCIDKKQGERFAFNLLFSIGLNGLIKGIIDRPRPYEKYSDITPKNSFLGKTHTGASFPSGHTQSASTFFYTGASIIKKNYLYVVATILVSLVAISRLYMGVHYFTDVLVGFLLGGIIVFISNIIFDKFYDKKYLLYTIFGIVLVSLSFLVKERTISDYIKTIGIYFGFIFGTYIENKYINLKMPKSVFKKVLRIIIGALIIGVIYIGLKLIPINLIIYDGIRYFIVGFSCFTLLPIILKKINF